MLKLVTFLITPILSQHLQFSRPEYAPQKIFLSDVKSDGTIRTLQNEGICVQNYQNHKLILAACPPIGSASTPPSMRWKYNGVFGLVQSMDANMCWSLPHTNDHIQLKECRFGSVKENFGFENSPNGQFLRVMSNRNLCTTVTKLIKARHLVNFVTLGRCSMQFWQEEKHDLWNYDVSKKLWNYGNYEKWKKNHEKTQKITKKWKST